MLESTFYVELTSSELVFLRLALQALRSQTGLTSILSRWSESDSVYAERVIERINASVLIERAFQRLDDCDFLERCLLIS